MADMNKTGQNPGGVNPSSTQSASATGTARDYSTANKQSGEQDWGTAARETAERGAQKGAEIYDKTRENLNQAYDRTKENLNQAYDRAAHSMQETWDQAVDYSRKNPGTASLIVFGAGIGVGMLIASNMTFRSRSQRIVPPIMRALSEIAGEYFG